MSLRGAGAADLVDNSALMQPFSTLAVVLKEPAERSMDHNASNKE
jgi:hypothetical protein